MNERSHTDQPLAARNHFPRHNPAKVGGRVPLLARILPTTDPARNVDFVVTKRSHRPKGLWQNRISHRCRWTFLSILKSLSKSAPFLAGIQNLKNDSKCVLMMSGIGSGVESLRYISGRIQLRLRDGFGVIKGIPADELVVVFQPTNGSRQQEYPYSASMATITVFLIH